MADRYPLVVSSGVVQELADGDNLNLEGNEIKGATSIGSSNITLTSSGLTTTSTIKVEHSGVGTAQNLLEFNTETANSRTYYAIGATMFQTEGDLPVVIKGDGKLGIGTTAPLVSIDVLGSVMAHRADFIDTTSVYPYPAYAAIVSDGALEMYRRNPLTVGYGTTPAINGVGGPYVDFKSTNSGIDYNARIQLNRGVTLDGDAGIATAWQNTLSIHGGGRNTHFDGYGNVHIGTAGAGSSQSPSYRATTKGSNALNIYNGTAPVGVLTNGISIYSSSGECYIMDSAGNATLQSPHDSATNEWIFKSKNTVTGKTLRVDMEKMMKALNDHFGWDFVTEE